MAHVKRYPDRGEPISPFAEATRTPVRAVPDDNLAMRQAHPSPARQLQAGLEIVLGGGLETGGAVASGHYSPRVVTLSVVAVCLAFWGAVYLAVTSVF